MTVEKTGMDTEMGKIAGMIGDIEDEQTPLQKDWTFGQAVGGFLFAYMCCSCFLGNPG